MKYIAQQRPSILDKRIPTVLALILLLAGLGTTGFFVSQTTILNIGASGSDVPQNLHVSNITGTSFTISYTTDQATTGTISYGKSQTLGTVVLDQRDQANNTPQPYTTHSITVDNLSPATTYYFSITSGSTTYLNNGMSYTATTGPMINTSSLLNQTVTGTVTTDGNAVGSILVYLQSRNGQMLSTLTDDQGKYTIPLVNLRTTDLLQYATLATTDTLTLIFVNGTAISHVTTTVENATVPTVLLGQDYDFTKTSSSIGNPSSNTSSESASFGFPASTNNAGDKQTPSIVSPNTNKTFSDQQPEFKGFAPAGEKVTIIIHSDQAIQTQVTTNANGQWTFRPTTPLSPGTHTITITAPDASGILRTITQSFVVFAAGTQVAEAATPSATLTPTLTPKPTQRPTTTPTTGLTAAPTATPTVTPTIELTATLTPEPTSLIPSPTNPTLPPTGNASILPIGIAGIVTTIIGAGLFIVTNIL